ncbi:hypothetical protein EWM64_g4135 [Hericium alpestre]|uniref:Uncharacterized protein n=1 Tax=Hericium alpestre TaxID=135208 RepID=A0A4Z0A130_9AGAM|nr:hypothetical protein EWM64_g4135 [Hericium alpestre]
MAAPTAFRKTRSRRIYSPYDIVIKAPDSFDLARIFQDAVARDGQQGKPSATSPTEQAAWQSLPSAPDGDPAAELPPLVDDDAAQRRRRLMRPGTSMPPQFQAPPSPSKIFSSPLAFRAPSPAPQSSSPGQSNCKPMKETGKHKHKRLKRHGRRQKDAKEAAREYQVREAMIVKYSEPLFIDLGDKDARDLPHADGAWVGISTKQALDAALLGKVFTWEELRKLGFKYFAWDGLKRVAIVDKYTRIIVMLAGRPPDPGWDASCERIYVAMSATKEDISIKTSPEQRRGDFDFINTGVSFGRGQQHPINASHGTNSPAIDRLLEDADLRRVAGFMASSFAVSAPKLYQHYEQNMAILKGSQPELKIPFDSPIYAGATFNFGPGVATTIHLDTTNLPYGWCSIIPFGRFNADKSAMFVLAQLGLVVRYPRHSLMHVPSAAIGHGNTVLAPGDIRASFTLYTKGSLFRWVEYGLQLEDKLKTEEPIRYQEIWKERPQRWEFGLGLLSKHAELAADIRQVFDVHPPEVDID